VQHIVIVYVQVRVWVMVEGYRSRVAGHRSRVESRGSKVEGQKSKVEIQESKMGNIIFFYYR
jgi:hypothetical protein